MILRLTMHGKMIVRGIPVGCVSKRATTAFMTRISAPKRPSWTRWETRAAWIAALCCTLGGVTAGAFTPADADAIFEAHTKAFYRVENGMGWHTKNTDGGKADFWMQAEMLEMVLDVHARTRSKKQLEMFDELFHGFIATHGRNWAGNEFNDDIMWMVIACTRAHLVTGNTEYRAVAKENFDLCYQRAISPDLGGGLWWKTDNKSKNACVNGPGSIAAFLLGLATGDRSYTSKARSLFLWERATLFDPKTGRVSDAINRDKRVNQMALTDPDGSTQPPGGESRGRLG